MTNKDTVFFYFSLPLCILNGISFIDTSMQFIQEQNFYNCYFLTLSCVMLIVYIIYYMMKVMKKNSFSKVIAVFMCFYSLAFLLVTDVRFFINYILCFFALIQIILSFSRQKAASIISVFISLYSIICIGKAFGYGSSLVETVEYDNSAVTSELFLILSIIVTSLLLTIVYMINNYFLRLEQREKKEQKEKMFKEACFRKDITKSEEPVLRLMLEGKGKNEIMRITGLKESNTRKKIASIKTKLQLRMYFTNQKEEVRRALFDD